MRAVVQRVDCASVKIGAQVKAAVAQGLLVFIGVAAGDSIKDADYLLDKISRLRIFEDGQGKMNRSLLDVSGSMVVVSQFTLLADCRKGRRPSFTGAEEPAAAKSLYEYFIKSAREKITDVQTGEFQAYMKVESVNDGPVTILLDSRREF